MIRWILKHLVLVLVLSALAIGLFNLDNLQGWLPGTHEHTAPEGGEASGGHASLRSDHWLQPVV